MIDSLSTFYRIGVSKGVNMILLKEEIKHVVSYLQIQQLRYEDEFTFYIGIDDAFF